MLVKPLDLLLKLRLSQTPHKSSSSSVCVDFPVLFIEHPVEQGEGLLQIVVLAVHAVPVPIGIALVVVAVAAIKLCTQPSPNSKHPQLRHTQTPNGGTPGDCHVMLPQIYLHKPLGLFDFSIAACIS